MYYKTIDNKKEDWILLIHCICSNMSIFENEIKNLSEKYNVLLVDLPGHGNSKGYVDFDFDSVTNEITKILNKLNIQKIDIWGISLGAIVALKLAIAEKERVNMLLFEDPAFGFGNRMLLNIFGIFNKVKVIIPPRLYLYLFIHLIIYGENKRKIKKMFFDHLKNTDKKNISKWLSLMYEEYKKDIKNELSSVDNFKVYIIGEKDYIFKPYILKNVKESEKNKIIILNKRSHVCNLEEKIDVFSLTNLL